jgi:hypothetical protein
MPGAAESELAPGTPILPQPSILCGVPDWRALAVMTKNVRPGSKQPELPKHKCGK